MIPLEIELKQLKLKHSETCKYHLKNRLSRSYEVLYYKTHGPRNAFP